MGSEGIRRRKPRRELRRLKRLQINDRTPGHVMWPEKGSGFEANPWSPAGRAQQAWIAVGNFRRYPKSIPLWPLIVVPAAAAAIVGAIAIVVAMLQNVL